MENIRRRGKNCDKFSELFRKFVIYLNFTTLCLDCYLISPIAHQSSWLDTPDDDICTRIYERFRKKKKEEQSYRREKGIITRRNFPRITAWSPRISNSDRLHNASRRCTRLRRSNATTRSTTVLRASYDAVHRDFKELVTGPSSNIHQPPRV